ncbi:uncharacterized protein A1O9_06852 [Exophiala aquamarina CBS 119918]|uniref:Uncharacterized protein n=1 Tax=Exophiala aquamarina CBS 119918 TaxID=1182545 RepID=A0A072PBM0_9EURO|nr:uncharacterized protein A1O9_06852 [Exophiala aquamarina CBS 119918]KEF56663.1 hypothetical protein A1O9_06852 [Exophiala aquamarina CBS 119918]
MSLFPRLDKQRLGDLEPHDWDLSSREHVRKFSISSKYPKTVIPDPAIFSDAIVPALKSAEHGLPTQYPNPGHVAAHLGLIECFRKFQQHVVTSEQLEILDLPSYPGTTSDGNAPTPTEDATANASNTPRWDTVVRLAIARFQIWFENIESIVTHAAAYHRFGPDSNALHAAFTADYLPPLDVMLVWYAYMQMPGAYRRDNLAHSSPKLLEIPLPWEAILAVMDLDLFTYNLPPAAEKLFTTTTTQSADIFVYLMHPPPYTNLNPEKAFSVDLESAVHELVDGGSFVESMSSLLFLRSPSLEGTLLRALAKYGALVQATGSRASLWLERIKEEPALQLVWRTHMLYPMAYIEFSANIFGSDILLKSDVDSLVHTADVKSPPSSEPSTGDNDSVSLDAADICYCWLCERIRDEVPDYTTSSSKLARRMLPTTSSGTVSQPASPTSRGFSHFRSRSMSSNTPQSADSPLSQLTKEQIASIKADVAFYRYVEDFRRANPDATTLPGRPATSRDLEKIQRELDAKKRVGTFHGMGYTVEVVRPAVYDEATGRLLKKEKTKVRRSKNINPTARIGGFMAGF